jgi:hypothetical protein
MSLLTSPTMRSAPKHEHVDRHTAFAECKAALEMIDRQAPAASYQLTQGATRTRHSAMTPPTCHTGLQ